MPTPPSPPPLQPSPLASNHLPTTRTPPPPPPSQQAPPGEGVGGGGALRRRSSAASNSNGAAQRPRRREFQKVVILGDGGVGKTALRDRFLHRRFTSNYRATIGADFITKDITVLDDAGIERSVSMQIWDTAGQERFQALGVAFWRGADACIIVYDVTNYASFRSVPNWLSEFIRQGDIGDPFNFPIAVIGNKTDLVGERIIYAPQMEELSRELKRICFEKSRHLYPEIMRELHFAELDLRGDRTSSRMSVSTDDERPTVWRPLSTTGQLLHQFEVDSTKQQLSDLDEDPAQDSPAHQPPDKDASEEPPTLATAGRSRSGRLFGVAVQTTELPPPSEPEDDPQLLSPLVIPTTTHLLKSRRTELFSSSTLFMASSQHTEDAAYQSESQEKGDGIARDDYREGTELKRIHDTDEESQASSQTKLPSAHSPMPATGMTPPSTPPSHVARSAGTPEALSSTPKLSVLTNGGSSAVSPTRHEPLSAHAAPSRSPVVQSPHSAVSSSFHSPMVSALASPPATTPVGITTESSFEFDGPEFQLPSPATTPAILAALGLLVGAPAVMTSVTSSPIVFPSPTISEQNENVAPSEPESAPPSSRFDLKSLRKLHRKGSNISSYTTASEYSHAPSFAANASLTPLHGSISGLGLAVDPASLPSSSASSEMISSDAVNAGEPQVDGQGKSPLILRRQQLRRPFAVGSPASSIASEASSMAQALDWIETRRLQRQARNNAAAGGGGGGGPVAGARLSSSGADSVDFPTSARRSGTPGGRGRGRSSTAAGAAKATVYTRDDDDDEDGADAASEDFDGGRSESDDGDGGGGGGHYGHSWDEGSPFGRVTSARRPLEREDGRGDANDGGGQEDSEADADEEGNTATIRRQTQAALALAASARQAAAAAAAAAARLRPTVSNSTLRASLLAAAHAAAASGSGFAALTPSSVGAAAGAAAASAPSPAPSSSSSEYLAVTPTLHSQTRPNSHHQQQQSAPSSSSSLSYDHHHHHHQHRGDSYFPTSSASSIIPYNGDGATPTPTAATLPDVGAVPHFEASAKAGEHVDEVFVCVAEMIVRVLGQQEQDQHGQMRLFGGGGGAGADDRVGRRIDLYGGDSGIVLLLDDVAGGEGGRGGKNRCAC